jgi:hypothetical protein
MKVGVIRMKGLVFFIWPLPYLTLSVLLKPRGLIFFTLETLRNTADS